MQLTKLMPWAAAALVCWFSPAYALGEVPGMLKPFELEPGDSPSRLCESVARDYALPADMSIAECGGTLLYLNQTRIATAVSQIAESRIREVCGYGRGQLVRNILSWSSRADAMSNPCVSRLLPAGLQLFAPVDDNVFVNVKAQPQFDAFRERIVALEDMVEGQQSLIGEQNIALDVQRQTITSQSDNIALLGGQVQRREALIGEQDAALNTQRDTIDEFDDKLASLNDTIAELRPLAAVGNNVAWVFDSSLGYVGTWAPESNWGAKWLTVIVVGLCVLLGTLAAVFFLWPRMSRAKWRETEARKAAERLREENEAAQRAAAEAEHQRQERESELAAAGQPAETEAQTVKERLAASEAELAAARKQVSTSKATATRAVKKAERLTRQLEVVKVAGSAAIDAAKRPGGDSDTVVGIPTQTSCEILFSEEFAARFELPSRACFFHDVLESVNQETGDRILGVRPHGARSCDRIRVIYRVATDVWETNRLSKWYKDNPGALTALQEGKETPRPENRQAA